MKRLIAIGLMLASTFALTNCVEELGIPNIQDEQLPNDKTTTTETEGVPFKIYASLESAVDTKTVGVKEGNTLKTQWVEGDKIIGIYEKENVCGKPIEFTIDAQNLSAGEFLGTIPAEVLNDKESKYNWYFIYGPAGYSVTNGTATVTINIPTDQSQDQEKPVAHIGGINCPMFGQALNLSGPIFPRVQMKHLATLHEVTVRNDTKANQISGADAGKIVVYDLGMSIATTGVWDKSNRLSLAGTFTLDLKSGKLKNYSGNKESIRLALPENGVSIDPGTTAGTTDNAHAFYFVTAPIESLQTNATYIKYYQKINDQANGPGIITQSAYEALPDKSTYKDVTEETQKLYKNKGNANDIKTEAEFNALPETEKANYAEFSTPEIDRQDIFTFSVNGSARTVQTNKTYDGFDGGKIKRFILPVREMQYPLASDACLLKWTDPLNNQTGDIVTFQNCDEISTTINGFPYNVWQVGKYNNGTLEPGVITIQGFAKELINALPAGFYAAQLNNQPTAMSLKHLQIWMPEYENNHTLTSRTVLKDYRMIVPVKFFEGTFLEYEVKVPIPMESVGGLLGMSFTSGITYDGLVGLGIDPNTISFDGIVPCGANDKLLIMDEGPVYKEMTEDLVDSFISRFSTPADTEKNIPAYTATLDGIKAIVNATIDDDGHLDFPTGIEDAEEKAYETANAVIRKLQNIVGDAPLGLDGILTVTLSEVISPHMFENAEDLMFQLRDMKFELAIQIIPHPSTKVMKPMLIWGLDNNAPTL